MSKQRDGGYAFLTDDPRQIGPHCWHHAGMSTRTWLAGLAMQGLCIREDYNGDAIRLAMDATFYADALLKELGK